MPQFCLNQVKDQDCKHVGEDVMWQDRENWVPFEVLVDKL